MKVRKYINLFYFILFYTRNTNAEYSNFNVRSPNCYDITATQYPLCHFCYNYYIYFYLKAFKKQLYLLSKDKSLYFSVIPKDILFIIAEKVENIKNNKDINIINQKKLSYNQHKKYQFTY